MRRVFRGLVTSPVCLLLFAGYLVLTAALEGSLKGDSGTAMVLVVMAILVGLRVERLTFENRSSSNHIDASHDASDMGARTWTPS